MRRSGWSAAVAKGAEVYAAAGDIVDLVDAATFHRMLLQTENKAEATFKSYKLYEGRFLAFLDERAPVPYGMLQRRYLHKEITEAEFQAEREKWFGLSQLNSTNVRQFILWMRANAKGPRGGVAAIAQATTVLTIWSTVLYREGVLRFDPLDRVVPPTVEEKEPIPFTHTEVMALYAAAAHSRRAVRDRLIVRFLVETGVRANELATLTLPKMTLASDSRAMVVRGKGRKERWIPFGDPEVRDGGETVRLLNHYRREREEYFGTHPRKRTDRLLLAHNGLPLQVSGIESIVKRLGMLADVEDCHPHRFRHTFATNYLTTHPNDAHGLIRLMGHIDGRMLERYLHLANHTLADRIAASSPFRRRHAG